MKVSAREGAVAAACAAAFVLFPGSRSFPAAMLMSFVPRGVLAGLIAGLTETVPASHRTAIACAGSAAFLGAIALLPLLGGAMFWLALPLGAVSAIAVAAAIRWTRGRVPRPLAVALALALVTGCHAWTLGLIGGPYAEPLRARERVYSQPLAPEGYSFDGEIYLRTLALMKQGASFYPAFQRSWREDARFDGDIASALSFREPALFYLWRFLPGSSGAGLLGWFVVFTVMAAIAGWFLAARFVDDGIALLGPIAMLSYFAFFVLASLSWFTFAEVWAACAVVLAVALLLRERWLTSALMIVAAVGIRELAILFVPAWVVAWALSRRDRRGTAAVAVAILGSMVPILIHLQLAPAGGGSGLSIGTWLHSTGFPRLMRALRHGTEFMPYGGAIGPLAAVVALGGAAALPGRGERWPLATAVTVPLAFLTGISASRYDFYWGSILIPLLLAMIPLVMSRALPSRTSRDRRPPSNVSGRGPANLR